MSRKQRQSQRAGEQQRVAHAPTAEEALDGPTRRGQPGDRADERRKMGPRDDEAPERERNGADQAGPRGQTHLTGKQEDEDTGQQIMERGNNAERVTRLYDEEHPVGGVEDGRLAVRDHRVTAELVRVP